MKIDGRAGENGRRTAVLLPRRLRSSVVGLIVLASLSAGCSLRWNAINVDAVERARIGLAMQEDQRHRFEDDGREDEREPPATGSVFVGELLAIFPGLFVHGLGHWYAGDYKTSAKLRRVGELGYVMIALGGGAATGAYFIDDSDSDLFGSGTAKDISVYTLYGTGGAVGGLGLVYFFTAWIYDMIDTPRAVRTGGRPPSSTPFVDSLDIFGGS